MQKYEHRELIRIKKRSLCTWSNEERQNKLKKRIYMHNEGYMKELRKAQTEKKLKKRNIHKQLKGPK